MVMKFFQQLGKSLMLPICVLPICGILMGIGYALCPAAMQGGDITGTANMIGYILVKAGGAIIDNISILFVFGVAIGMSEDGHGTATLAGVVSWLVITRILSPDVMSVFFGNIDPGSTAYIAYSKIQNPFIGIIAGLIGAFSYNRFKDTKLPDFLAFFSGRRFVSIVAVLLSLLVAMLLAFVWPVCFGAMVKFGQWIVSLGGIGCGIYAFLNRLLIPTGLHHALNNVFWFDTIGLGDLTNFWAGKTSADVGWSLGMYMSGFFPCMMGGVAGAALAMYTCAKNKKKAMGVLLSTAFCSFLCGLTEPFEFSFMFLCFPLYVVYSALYGIFAVITYYTGFRAGISFSAGLIDLVCSSSLPAAQKTLLSIPLILAAFVVFFLVFSFIIRKFNIQTIGKDDEDSNEQEMAEAGDSVSCGDKEMSQARGLLKAVGGKSNVVEADCCATRLRLDVKDCSLVDAKLAKHYGAIDVVCPGNTSCQIIIGPTVQQVLDKFRKALKEAETDETPEKVKGTTSAAAPEIMGQEVAGGETIYIPLKKEARKTERSHPSVSEIPFQKEADGTVVFTFIVRDPSGIHARPAGQIAKIVKEHGVTASIEANGKSASGSSPVEMMELGVKEGSKITVKIHGDPQASEATANELGCFISENL